MAVIAGPVPVGPLMPEEDDMTADRILVNMVEAHNVGHAIEALRYALGHRAAAPDGHIGLALNAATPTELASLVDGVDEVFAVPMTDDVRAVEAALERIPRAWTHALHNLRTTQPAHADVVPGFRTTHDLLRAHVQPTEGHGLAGVPMHPTPGYVKHQEVCLRLPAALRAAAADELGAKVRIAVLPAGSGARSLYPSVGSWQDVIAALRREHVSLEVVLVGKLARDGRTSSALTAAELAALRGPGVVDAFDRPLLEQLALVEACDVFVSTHSGFGWAALAVGTPWATISGGQWPEVFFNGVPFVSVLPDPDRWGRYSLYEPPPVQDDEGVPRSPHASRARIRADLPRIVEAVGELLAGERSYEEAMRTHFAQLLDHLGPDRSALFAVDGAHLLYVT